MSIETFDHNSANLQTFSDLKAEDGSSKANSIGNQLLVWDLLLETRIKMQKLLVSSNKLPQFDLWLRFVETSDVKSNAVNATKELCDLLASMLELTDYIKIRNEANESVNQMDDDENISSDVSDDDTKCVDAVEDGGGALKKKMKFSDCEDRVCQHYDQVKSLRNHIIDDWYERTRYATPGKMTKSMEMFEQSAVKSIEHVLSNRKRLIKRTQLKRSLYEVVGKAVVKNDSCEDNENYDSEIFDDDDFYHQLLRELIDSKTEKTVDPVALSRKWLQIQRMRSKLKRKVDTRASKGRKIRYEVHSKLINFMAPCDELNYTSEAKNELFSSLFGKRKYLC